MLQDSEWDTFFALLTKIVNAPRPYGEKEADVIANADSRDALTELQEFVNWDFSEEDM